MNFITQRSSQGRIGAHGLVWPILGALGALDPGSNPGAPTFSFSDVVPCSLVKEVCKVP